MPGLDGTGPLGLGPRTGRGLGYCAGGRAFARGWWGRGLGNRNRWRNRFFWEYPPETPSSDPVPSRENQPHPPRFLRHRLAALEEQIHEMQHQIEELYELVEEAFPREQQPRQPTSSTTLEPKSQKSES